ncbi:MAG: hypothetical protein R3C28_24130 [Pirellulaceae bacterium]
MQASPGRTIHLNLAEMGAVGDADGVVGGSVSGDRCETERTASSSHGQVCVILRPT